MQQEMSPAAALERLAEGNRRFVERKPKETDLMEQVHATAGGQYPFAAILGCIDSVFLPN